MPPLRRMLGGGGEPTTVTTRQELPAQKRAAWGSRRGLNFWDSEWRERLAEAKAPSRNRLGVGVGWFVKDGEE